MKIAELRAEHRAIQDKHQVVESLAKRLSKLGQSRQAQAWKQEPHPYVRSLNGGEVPTDPIRFLALLESELEGMTYRLAQRIADLAEPVRESKS